MSPYPIRANQHFMQTFYPHNLVKSPILLFYGKIVLHPLYYTYEITIQLENLSSLEGTHYECS